MRSRIGVLFKVTLTLVTFMDGLQSPNLIRVLIFKGTVSYIFMAPRCTKYDN